MKEKVTKSMIIGEIAEKHPHAVEVMLRHGLHCIGCHVASWETLEQGAQSHGIDADRMVHEINKTINAR